MFFKREDYTNVTSFNASSSSSGGNFQDGSQGFLSCFTVFDNIVKVLPMKRSIIVVFYIILSIVNTVMNSLSIYVNVTTNHWKNQSMRMVLYISVIDILNGVIAYGAHVVYILIPDQLDCQQRRSLLLSSHLFYMISLYIIMFVAFDRFLHVWFLSHYKDAVTPAKFNSVLAFYLLAIFIYWWVYGKV